MSALGFEAALEFAYKESPGPMCGCIRPFTSDHRSHRESTIPEPLQAARYLQDLRQLPSCCRGLLVNLLALHPDTHHC